MLTSQIKGRALKSRLTSSDLSQVVKHTIHHKKNYLRSCNLLVCTGDDKISIVHGY